MLSNLAATSQVWLFKFKAIYTDEIKAFRASVTLATPQVLNSHAELVVTVARHCRFRTFPSSQKVPLDSTDLNS